MPTLYKPKKKREYNDYNSKRNRRQSVYNTTRWRDMRLAKLMQNPECEICALEGHVTLAEDVHHLTSFVDFEDENIALAYGFEFNNLCSVCKKCHSRCHTGDLKGTTNLEKIKQRIDAKKHNG